MFVLRVFFGARAIFGAALFFVSRFGFAAVFFFAGMADLQRGVCALRVEQATVGARGVDSYPFSVGGTAAQAVALRDMGVDFLVGYLGVISPMRLGGALAAGLAFMPVTVAGEFFDGPADEVAQLKALGIPPGVTVWLDLEGQKSFGWPALDLIEKINAWADAIRSAGYEAGLYVGVPQPLTSDELWSLRVTRYWRGQGSIRDRHNRLAEPTKCGWCMTQMYPAVRRAGIDVDFDIIGQDYLRRVPSWVRA